jgi:hypothetical protein
MRSASLLKKLVFSFQPLCLPKIYILVLKFNMGECYYILLFLEIFIGNGMIQFLHQLPVF